MINFRELFNSNYSYIMLIAILVLFIIIVIINNKDYKRSIKVVSNILIISSIICISIYLIVKLLLSLSFLETYKFLIDVISNTFNRELLIRSIIWFVLGLALKIVNKHFL